ncbi:sugar ABC transporter ATP-binding protein [Amphritea atlantica]|uniref:Sugar ABC transporter ATP-binding protein n=1 Tax=Amphritea atlantica TaxID=355243 RepID=A0ABY5GXA9_9GAMM|nr:sugar ABC transporter ATP-binding protein [Amphritea atlantica]
MQSNSPLLTARNIDKVFPGVVALNQVNFTLQPGEIHALLGENGAGKSTLIKCLTGAYQRDGGEVFLEGSKINPRDTLDAQTLGIGTVYQEVNLLGNLSVAQNMLMGREPTSFGLISVKKLNQSAREILSQYGVLIDVAQPLSTYSVALQQIIAIARAVDLSAKVLILDEPTASLDTREVQMLFDILRRLKDQGVGIIFISHFLDQVFEISDMVTILRNGELIGSKTTKDMDRLELVNMMLGYELNEEIVSQSPELKSPTPLIKFENFGHAQKVAPFDLTINKGEVVGLAGLLGSGRTETAEMLFGLTPNDSGTSHLNGVEIQLNSPRSAIENGFAFCPEDRKNDGIIGELSVRENLILALQAQRGWFQPLPKAEQNELCERYIKALDIRPADSEKQIQLLSGGNQQKVILARWLAINPSFLILDEPTRGIDVGAHAEIIRLIEGLCEKGMSLLVISSELEELVTYSHRVVIVRDRKQVAELGSEQITTNNIIKSIAGETGNQVLGEAK